jgi:hypothetical protein
MVVVCPLCSYLYHVNPRFPHKCQEGPGTASKPANPPGDLTHIGAVLSGDDRKLERVDQSPLENDPAPSGSDSYSSGGGSDSY